MLRLRKKNTLDATVNVTTQPDCGANNGEVDITVTGGIGSYIFQWETGIGTNVQTGLSSGVHNVTITDTGSTGCILYFSFVLTDNVPQGTVLINNEGSVSCNGAIDGSVDFEVNYDVGFAAPADTTITDGTNNFVNGNLPPGDYCIVITDFNGCVAGGECFTISEPDPIELLFIVDPGCDADSTGTIDLTITGGTTPYNVDWADLPGSNDPEDRINLLKGTYDLTISDANGCEIIEDVNIDLPCACSPPQVNSIIAVETVCGLESGSATINLESDPGGLYLRLDA